MVGNTTIEINQRGLVTNYTQIRIAKVPIISAVIQNQTSSVFGIWIKFMCINALFKIDYIKLRNIVKYIFAI